MIAVTQRDVLTVSEDPLRDGWMVQRNANAASFSILIFRLCDVGSSGVAAGPGRHVPAPVQELRGGRERGQRHVLLQPGQREAHLR